jgi:hypothetical protein
MWPVKQAGHRDPQEGEKRQFGANRNGESEMRQMKSFSRTRTLSSEEGIELWDSGDSGYSG